LPGALDVASSGAIELNLLGAFDLGAAMQMEAIPVLHGYDGQNRPVTLTGLLGTGFNLAAPGLQRTRYRVGRMFLGEHIGKSEKFDELLIATTFLPDWVAHHSLISDAKRRFGQHHLSPGVAYRWPPRYHARVGEEARVDVITSASTTQSRLSVALSEEVFLRVRVTKPLPADTLVSRFGRPLLDLICLGTQRANAYTRVVVGSHRYARRLAPHRIARKEIEFVAEWITAGVPPVPDSLLIPDDQLFTLPDEVVPFPELISQWMPVWDELAECITPYFALVYAPPTFQDTRLVTIAQCLEAYHRLRYPQTLIPEAEFKPIRRAMVKLIPEEQRSLLGGRLKHLTELTQKERLRELVEQTRPVLPGLFEDQPGFVEDLVEQRNRRAHPAGGTSSAPMSAPALYRVVRTAEYVVQACLMQELGFGAATADLFRRNREYAWFVAQIPSLG
jgi:hypothetical protein